MVLRTINRAQHTHGDGATFGDARISRAERDQIVRDRRASLQQRPLW
jgi:hypothetical protein